MYDGQYQIEDPKPKFNPNKPFTAVKEDKPAFDPNKPFEDVKKKEDGIAAGTLNGNGLKSNEKQKLLDYMQGLKSPEEKKLASPQVITQKPIKKNERPFDMVINDQSVAKAHEKLGDIMLGENDKWKDPVKEISQQATKATTPEELNTLNVAAQITRNSLAGDGFEANRILNDTHLGMEGADNLTKRMLKDRADKYNQATAPLKEIKVDFDLSKASPEYLDNDITPELKNAAIKYGAQQDPEFAKELEKAGVDLNDKFLSNKVSSLKTGQWLDRMLNDQDVHSYLQKENPNLIPAAQRAAQTIRTDNKDYGINQVASEVSRAVQKSGFNNIDPIFNYYGEGHKEYADQIAQQLYKDDPQSLAIWNKEIKDKQEDYMDAPSLFQGIAESGKNFGQGIVNTFTKPFTPTSELQKEKWDKEAANISADPEGLSKFLRDSGHAIGTVAGIAATANVLGGAGLSSNAASMTSIGVGFFGDQLEQKRLRFDNPALAYTSALLNTGMYMMMGKRIFPADKIKQAFGEVSPSVDNIVENLASGNITREAARQELVGLGRKMIDLAGGTLSKNLKITADLTAIDQVGKLADEIMGGNPPDEDDLEKAGTTFLSNIAIAGLAKFGEMRSGNKIVENSLDKAASTPLQTQRLIEELNESPAMKQERLDNLNFLVGEKKKLVDNEVDPKQHSRFLFDALREKIKKDQIASLPESAVTRRTQNEIRGLQDTQDKILRGEDVAGDEISKPIQLDTELPKDYKLPEQPTPETEVNIPKQHEELIAERDKSLDEAHKPELPKLETIPDEDLVNSKDRGKNLIRHDEITNKFSKLKEILNCIWGD